MNFLNCSRNGGNFDVVFDKIFSLLLWYGGNFVSVFFLFVCLMSKIVFLNILVFRQCFGFK